jgi:hypothetical protein
MGTSQVKKGAVRNILLRTGLTRAAKARQKSTVLYWHEEPDEPTKEEPLSYVLQESLFASVSTVSSRDHPSLVSLVTSNSKNCKKGVCAAGVGAEMDPKRQGRFRNNEQGHASNPKVSGNGEGTNKAEC